MKFSAISAAALCASVAAAVPTANWGGWQGNQPPACPQQNCPAPPPNPFMFTSAYHVVATPDQVLNGTTPTGGLSGAIGYYDLGLNRYTNTICYNITLIGFRGNYSSPARTATHMHQAARGQSGPPRIAFPNPVGNSSYANSIGCIKGPFMTGINGTDGRDTGAAFNVAQVEANPAGFYVDVHSSLAIAGAVRGQLA